MDISKLKVDVSGLKISVSSAEVVRKIIGITGNLKNLSVGSIGLGDNEAYVTGRCSHVFGSTSFSASVKILTPSTLPSSLFCGPSEKVGFKIADVSGDGWTDSVEISIASGFSRRETFVAEKVVAAICKLNSPTDIGSCVRSSGSTIWVDVKKLATCLGVRISGTISDFTVSANAIEIEIQPAVGAPCCSMQAVPASYEK